MFCRVILTRLHMAELNTEVIYAVDIKVKLPPFESCRNRLKDFSAFVFVFQVRRKYS